MSKEHRRIFVITDSLGLPRVNPELVSVDDCWPQIIKKELSDQVLIYQYSIGGMDSRRAKDFLENFLDSYQADLVILQFGIVDCCPRALRKFELNIIKALPKFISGRLHLWIKKHRKWIVSKRNLNYVSLKEFDLNLRAINKLIHSTSLFINIASPNLQFQKNTPKIDKAIKDYNTVISKNFTNVLDYKNNEEIFSSDFHHLNEKGHKCLALSVLEWFRNE